MNDEEVKDAAWDDSEESEALDEEVEGGAEAGEGAANGSDAAAPAGGRTRGRRSKRDDEVEIQPSDARSKQALEFVVDVVREMELDCRVRLRRPKDGDSPDEINIEIIGRDAGLAIGKIDPARFGGGKIGIDPVKAEAALAAGIGNKRAMSAEPSRVRPRPTSSLLLSTSRTEAPA